MKTRKLPKPSIEMLRFFAKRQTGDVGMILVYDGKELHFALTEERLLYAIESGIEAMRELRFGSD